MGGLIAQAQAARVMPADVTGPPLFPMSRGCDLAPLTASIAAVGQISPLVLLPGRRGLSVVMGHKRKQALDELGAAPYRALILPEDADPAEALVLALEDNLSVRSFNDAEKVLAAGWLADHFPRQTILGDWAARLGLPPKPAFLDRCLACRRLGEEGLDLLAAGGLDLETGAVLADMAAADQQAVLGLFRETGPNRNQRREMLTWLVEIAAREGATAAEVIGSEDIQVDLAAGKGNAPQKGRRVRESLRRRRFPVISDLEGRRSAALKGLALPEQVSLDFPPHFEGLGFTLKVHFQSAEDVRRAASVLDRLADDPHLAELLEVG